jgi:putative ATPase
VNTIGFPEARIILSQCVIYLATSQKSNASYQAINDAQALIKETGDLSVPLTLRNAPTKLMKDLGYGNEYKYAHNYENNFIQTEFMPEDLTDKVLFNPGKNKREDQLRQFLKQKWTGKYNY